MKKITMYQTTDGQNYEKENEARYRQKAIDLDIALKTLASELNLDESFATAIKDNAKELKRILNKFA